MKRTSNRSRHMVVVLALAIAGCALPSVGAAKTLHVCATTPDLGSLVEAIGGDAVAVSVFAKPSEDPHFVDARPSFVRELNDADLLVLNGLELEIGWLPALVQNARNPRILPGGTGYADASAAIAPLDVPAGSVDRSMGDVHPQGNPHYLLDPINALRVAALLRERLAALQPASADPFAKRYEAFKGDLARRLAGEQLAARYDIEKLARLQEAGKLLSFLDSTGERALLGGWWGELLPSAPIAVVQDHRIWPYFARRFGLEIVAELEPKPGIAPTTKHIAAVAEIIRAKKANILMTAAYYDPKYGDFLAAQTGIAVVRMANQAGARPDTSAYLDMAGFNVAQIATALRKHSGSR